MKKWISNLEAVEDNNFKFDCHRCSTKSTHATLEMLLGAQEEYPPEPSASFHRGYARPFDREEFFILRCSICGAFSIVNEYYEGHLEKQIVPGSTVERYNNIFGEPKRTVFPIGISVGDVPLFVKEDYRLMHLCNQIGSPHGVSVHCSI